jgi:NADP-dependent 3-hydroxy acid dehydrogenase YdfG
MKTIIVSGATKNIGHAITKKLSEKYHIIAIARDYYNLDYLYHDNHNVDIYAMNLTHDNELNKFKEYINDKEIYGLINNAGGINDVNSVDHGNTQMWEESFNINALVPLKLSKIVIPHMIDYSTIINITSVVALRPFAQMASYSGAKIAESHMTKVLRLDLMQKNIKVTEIAPAMITEGALQPEDIANTIEWIFNLPEYCNVDSLTISHIKNTIY